MPANKKAKPLETLRDIVDDAARRNEAASKSAHQKKKSKAKAKAKAKASGVNKTDPPEDTPGTFYVYDDSDGIQHIVDSVKMVPKVYRKHTKRWVMDAGDERGAGEIDAALSDGISSLARTMEAVVTPSASSSTAPLAPGFHLSSFLLGLVLGTVLFVGSFLLKKKSSLLVKAVIGLVVATIAGAAYFGWIRRQAGLSGDIIAEPRSMINDARKAADLLQQRQITQERRLEEIEKPPEKTLTLP